MAKPIVLLIHGMGTHAEDATKDAFIKGLSEGANFLKFSDFDPALFQIHEFNYSDELDEIRKEIAEHANDVSQTTQILAGMGGLAAIVGDFMEFQADFADDKFLYTHLLDVFLYASTFHGVKIAEKLSLKINDFLKLASQKNTKLHIVAHSLGTKVTTDAMHLLFKNGVDVAGANQIDPALMRPSSLWMISNVSRLVGILDGFPDPYDTIVTDHYDLSTGQLGATAAMYNTSNTYDPFTWFKSYEKEPKNGYNIHFNDIRKISYESSFINPHSLAEYFAYPEIAMQFLIVAGDYAVPTQTFLDARKEYKKGTVKGAVKSILGKIKRPLPDDMPNDASFIEKARYLVKAYKALKLVKEQTQEYFSTGGQ
jgi:hypothetical protein